MRRVDPSLLAGLILCGLLLAVAVYGDRIAPHEPIFLLVNGPPGSDRPLAPGQPFALGSDPVGRDLLGLVLVGARTTLSIVALAGLARLAVGLALAVLTAWFRLLRGVIDAIADIASAVPSTIVAVFAVLVFARQGALAPVFVAALLITGWAGPYRLLRTELARLRAAPFTEGAVALGVGRFAVFTRHHLPHLVPMLALSASQQIAAALVALAELGVIGVFVGPTRRIDLAEAMRIVPFGFATSFRVPDIPEWGGLLALGRGFQSLYVSRWVFLVPGLAIAVAAVSVTLLGLGIARQYRRRNLVRDLMTRRSVVGALLVISLVAPVAALPPMHAEAVELGDAARRAAVVGSDPDAAFTAAGLAVTPIDRTTTQLRSTGPASLRIDGPGGPVELGEGAAADFTPLLIGESGGGSVDAPLVFAGWGVSPGDFPRQQVSVFSAPDFGTAVASWEDDYERVDVRGKVALIFRFPNIRLARSIVPVPPADQLLRSALVRGAVGILLVDANRSQLMARGQPDPFARLVKDDPLTSQTGVPIFLLTPAAADRILGPAGISASAILRGQLQGETDRTRGASMARDLASRAHLELPIGPVTETSRSLVALTPGSAGSHRLVIWAVAPSLATGSRSAADALVAVVRSLGGQARPALAFVVFDPRGDPLANAIAVRATLGSAVIDDVLAIESLGGPALRFSTTYGDLVPAVDAYAAAVGASAARTAAALSPGAAETGDLMQAAGLSVFTQEHWVLVSGQGPVTDSNDLRADAAAVIAYAIGRYARQAPELVR